MRGLWQFGKATFRKAQADQITYLAAAVSYYAIFSLFPTALGLIALASLFLDQPNVKAVVEQQLIATLPVSASLVARNIDSVIEARATLGLVSIVGFFWSATGVFSAIRTALNRAWGVEHSKPFLKAKLLELVLVLSLGVLLILSVGLTWFFETAATLEVPLLGLQPFASNPLWDVVRTLTPLALTILVLTLLYRYVPDAPVTWPQALLGAVVTAPLFEVAKSLFVWYAENKANYALVYGSVGAVIALLTWAYISAIILLLGAEIGAVYARRSSPGTTDVAQRTEGAPHLPARSPHVRRSRAGWLLLAATILAVGSLLVRCLRPTPGKRTRGR